MINYSRTIVFYNIYFNFVVPYLCDPANMARLGITAAQVSELTALQTKWNLAYKNYIFPGTYGKLTTAEINAIFKICKAYTDGVKQQLKGNPSVTLTESDFMFIGIHKDAKPRTNIPAPSQEAEVIAKVISHLNNEYHVFDKANPSKIGKPIDVKRIKIKYLVQKADVAPPTLDMLKDWDNIGSMNFDIPFTLDEIGSIVYVSVCFSNDSGDGNWSEIIASPII